MKMEHRRRALPLRLRLVAGCAKTIALFSLLALSLGTTYAPSSNAFSDSDLLGILALGAAVNGGALLFVLLPCAPWIANAWVSILVVFGIASSHAIHTDLLFTNPLMLWSLLGAAGLASFVAFGAIDRSPSLGLTLVALVSTVTSLVAADHLLARDDPPPALVEMSNVRDVSFERRPNVYLLSFDAMAPRVLLQKHMDLETTPFHDLFAARFRRFENFFANGISTTISLGLVAALDERWFNRARTAAKVDTDNSSLQLLSGHVESPLFRIFKNNDYETTFAYGDSFFGKTKGPFLDRYFIGGDSALCHLLDARIQIVAFWGHCLLNRQRRLGSDVWQQVIDHLGEASFRDGPQFAMAHIYHPGHTAPGFRYSDEDHLRRYRAGYVHRSGIAAKLLARLLAHLDANDPQAILLVYGDHGPFLSRRDVRPLPLIGLEFVVQDHYGILGGVYPPDVCQKWFDRAQERRAYLTLLDAVHAVIECLSGGESVLHVSQKDHPVGVWHGVVPDGDLRTYAEFLYE